MEESLNLYIGDKEIEFLGEYDSSKLNANISSLTYDGIVQTGQTIKNIIKNEKDETLQEYSIVNGELKYIGVDLEKANMFANIKYETLQIEVATALSDTGVVTLLDAKNGYLDSYKIYGQSVQNGTPSPTNPIEVQSVGEDENIEIVSSGKNMFYNCIPEDTAVIGGVTFTFNSDGSITLNGTGTTGGGSRIIDFYRTIDSSQKNKPVTISLKANKNIKCDFFCGYFNKDKVPTNYISYGALRDTNTSATSQTGFPSEAATTRMWIGVKEGVVYDNVIIYPQVELGSVETAFEKYNEPQTSLIDLSGHEPLRKIGESADYIDYENSRIVRNTRKTIIDGNTVKFSKNGNFWNLPWYSSKNISYSSKVISNLFPKQCFSINDNYDFIWTTNSLIGNYYSTVDSLNSYVLAQYNAGNPVELYYKTETPEYEYINLPKIKTFEGTTNITVNSTVVPSNINLKYIKSLE